MNDTQPEQKNCSIAISGDLGSGKSSVAKQLAARLSVDYVSTGDLHRSIADDRNLSTLELNRVAEHDMSIDQEVDARLKRLSDDGAYAVIDSRMAWWFVPYALSVHLTVLPDVGAKRVLSRGGQSVESYSSEVEARTKLRVRANSERTRFMNLYGVDPNRLRNYDLVIDTTYLDAEMVVARIDRELRGNDHDQKTAPKKPKLVLSPRALFPSQPIRELSSSQSSAAISLGYAYPYFFIINGHNRTARALENRSTTIAAELIAEGSEAAAPGISAHDYFSDAVSWSRIHDWNEVFGTALNL